MERRPGRALRAALAGCLVLAVALVVVITLLIAGTGTSGTPAALPTPSGSAKASEAPTVSDIYHHVGPSVAVVRTAKGALGTGVDRVRRAARCSPPTTSSPTAPRSASSSPTAPRRRRPSPRATPRPTSPPSTPATLPQTVVPATLGGGAQVGGDVVAIGNPLGLTYSVSSGVVSGLNRTTDTDQGKLSGPDPVRRVGQPRQLRRPPARRQRQRHRHRRLHRRAGRAGRVRRHRLRRTRSVPPSAVAPAPAADRNGPQI